MALPALSPMARSWGLGKNMGQKLAKHEKACAIDGMQWSKACLR